MKRTHISKEKTLNLLRNIKPQGISPKPWGFWYGVDGAWEAWCRAEEWGLSGKMFEHELTLGEERILTLSDVLELDVFHERYKAFPEYDKSQWFPYIDWRKVCGEYDGIEIAPYQWKRRLDGQVHNWYHGWDCASGCIWMPKGTKLTLLRTLSA